MAFSGEGFETGGASPPFTSKGACAGALLGKKGTFLFNRALLAELKMSVILCALPWFGAALTVPACVELHLQDDFTPIE